MSGCGLPAKRYAGPHERPFRQLRGHTRPGACQHRDPSGPLSARLTVEYDGTGFAGWARQPGLRTVQATMEEAIATLRGGRGVELTCAGRTDRGVHAWGQIVSHAGEPAPLEGLNALLPADVAILASEPAPDGFDARWDAISRTYCFRLHIRPVASPFEVGRALHWPRPIDRDALAACAAAVIGRHDFTAFTPTESEHVRFDRVVLSAEWHRRGDTLEFWITADAFLRHMNRVLVGTMLQVATGRRSLTSFVELLDGRPREEAGPTAPPHGLYFASVAFP